MCRTQIHKITSVNKAKCIHVPSLSRNVLVLACLGSLVLGTVFLFVISVNEKYFNLSLWFNGSIFYETCTCTSKLRHMQLHDT